MITDKYWSYRLASFLSRIMPEKLAYWFGLRIADAFCRHRRQDRENVLANLRTIFEARGVYPSETLLEGTARKTFQYFGKYLIDFFRFARVTQRDVRRRVSMDHKEYLDDCLARGKGVLIVTAHFGNWELGGGILAAMGYKVNALFLPQRLEKINRMFQKQREKRGVNVIPVGQSAFKIVRHLRQGEIVALLGDRDFTGKDDRIVFFGKPARIPRGPAWLSSRTRAPILPAFILRLVDDTFLLRFYPPIWPEEGMSMEDIRRRLCDVMEKEIGEHPHQWFIFDHFWGEGSEQPTEQSEVS